jgi:hypothetical protein
MAEQEHTYPSDYPPGTHWATDEAWHILDILTPGVLSDDVRAFLAGAIAGTLMRVARARANVQHTDTPRPPAEGDRDATPPAPAMPEPARD